LKKNQTIVSSNFSFTSGRDTAEMLNCIKVK
jgi:hypothetical protein